MKKLITISAIAIALISCKKENQACEVGDSCLVKSDVFNKGAYQPHHVLHADSVNHHYSQINNRIYLDMRETWMQGDTIKNLEWYFPQEDLRRIGK